MEKPGTNGRVVAAKVYDIKPMFRALHQKVIHVLNDDDVVLTENLPIQNYSNLNLS